MTGEASDPLPDPMKHRILHSYILRFSFLTIAGFTAVSIMQIQKLSRIPSMLRRVLG